MSKLGFFDARKSALEILETLSTLNFFGRIWEKIHAFRVTRSTT